MNISLPGDKSISHRALMLAALADGKSKLKNLTPGIDVASTRRILVQCGIPISESRGTVTVEGQGGKFTNPEGDLDAGNSGTTARLLIGLLAGRNITGRFVGDVSLSRRPMGRVVHPLLEMGAHIEITARQTLPLCVKPTELGSLEYTIPVASAQVKSSLLLAGLGSEGTVRLIEPILTRNHTELMLKHLGVDLKVNGPVIELGAGIQKIKPFNATIPGDPSSAAFPAAMAVLLPGKQVTFKDLMVNPTRMGFFRALQRMGAKVKWKSTKTILGEEVGTLTVGYSELTGLSISGPEVPTLIDEIPVLAILAARAKGETVIRDAGELRLKECDRIKAICENLRRMGSRIQELADGFRILGPVKLRGATISTYSDHRIAMAFAIAGRLTADKTNLDDPDCVNISFPGYHDLITKIAG